MNKLIGVLVTAVVLSAGMASSAQACYCGAARCRVLLLLLSGRLSVLHRYENVSANRLRAEAIHVLSHLL